MGMLQGGLLGQAAPAGDTITLNNAHCEADMEGDSAQAQIRGYGEATAGREGECWLDIDEAPLIFNHDIIVPGSNADDYQMKWESLSGTDPNWITVSASTWHPLSTSFFRIGWDWSGGEGGYSGSVTVSIRKGTGSVLDTAVWDGDVQATPPEKGK